MLIKEMVVLINITRHGSVLSRIIFRIEMKGNINRIHGFILKRIGEVQAQIEKSTDQMDILKLAVTELSYAHILSQYLQDRSFLFGALMGLARAYIGTESY